MFVVQSKYVTDNGIYWVYWGKFRERVELKQRTGYTEMMPSADWYYTNGWAQRRGALLCESKIPNKMLVNGNDGALAQKQVINLW